MTDTWFFAALCFGFLTLCALLRVIPGPEKNDRVVSLTAAITLAAAAAPVLSIASGNLFILDVMIIVVLLFFAGTIGYMKFCCGDAR